MTRAIGRDPTYLSSLQQRLQATHEKLLQMDGSQCPPYVALNDLQAYKSVFGPQGFCCRFRSCPASESGLPSIVLRTNHETQHFPTHSCKECDFSVRGFKSKGALNRHTMKYHPKLQKMELPQQLFSAARSSLVGARSLPSSQYDALTDVGQPQPISAQLLQLVKESVVQGQGDQIQHHIIASLQQQGPFSGWQAAMTLDHRAIRVRLLIDSLRLIKPVIEVGRAVQVASSFEQKAFIQSQSLDAYYSMCKEKLDQIHDTRQQQQQQQRIDTEAQNDTNFTQSQQKEPLPKWKPSKEDNDAINKLAVQMAEKTPQEDIAKIRANLDNMTMQQREIMSQKGVDPLRYFFRTQAAKEYRRQKMNAMAAGSITDGTYPKVTRA
jgi:hypothetical protein